MRTPLVENRGGKFGVDLEGRGFRDPVRFLGLPPEDSVDKLLQLLIKTGTSPHPD